jgi:hypothetical protein
MLRVTTLYASSASATTADGRSVAVTAATNDHVDAINGAVQGVRLTLGQLRCGEAVWIAGGEIAHPCDIIATRRNDRNLQTSTGEPVRNRDLWDVVAVAETDPSRSFDAFLERSTAASIAACWVVSSPVRIFNHLKDSGRRRRWPAPAQMPRGACSSVAWLRVA